MANSAFFAVTPSDTVPLQQPVSWLYIGSAGNLAIYGQGDATPTLLESVPVGWMRFPARVAMVGATSTTAGFIVASVGDQPSSH